MDPQYLNGPKVYSCANCRTHAAEAEDIISKACAFEKLGLFANTHGIFSIHTNLPNHITRSWTSAVLVGLLLVFTGVHILNVRYVTIT